MVTCYFHSPLHHCMDDFVCKIANLCIRQPLVGNTLDREYIWLLIPLLRADHENEDVTCSSTLVAARVVNEGYQSLPNSGKTVLSSIQSQSKP